MDTYCQVGGYIEQLSVFFLNKIVIDYLGSNTPIPSLFQLQKQLVHCECLSICQINTTKVVQSCPTKMGRLCFEKREIFLWLVKLTLKTLVRPKLKLYQNYLIYALFDWKPLNDEDFRRAHFLNLTKQFQRYLNFSAPKNVFLDNL